jgi:hypothetical protein
MEVANGCIGSSVSRLSADTNVGAETFKVIALFCGTGLIVFIVLATYGLDLSPEFF